MPSIEAICDKCHPNWVTTPSGSFTARFSPTTLDQLLRGLRPGDVLRCDSAGFCRRGASQCTGLATCVEAISLLPTVTPITKEP